MSRLRRTRKHARTALISAATAAAFAPAAHAFEHITLRTGFTIDCVRHEPLDADHTRLFMTGEGNYQDLRSADIVSVEVLPDPPAPAPLTSAVEAVLKAPPGASLTAAEMHVLLAAAGAAHNIDEDLLLSVIRTESGGNVRAVSRTGARGLMQLMPETAHSMGVKDPNKPDQNINGGTAYLDALLKRYKDDVVLALAAYNAGPGAVDRYHGVPPFRETRAYVTRVLNDFNRRKKATVQSLAATVSSR